MHAVCVVPVMIPGFVPEELHKGVQVIDTVLHWSACQTPSTLRRDLTHSERNGRGREGIDGEKVRGNTVSEERLR